MINLGKNIKKLRIEKGYTRSEFAEKLHIAVCTLDTWESSKHSPSVASCCEIADVLEIDLETLIRCELE